MLNKFRISFKIPLQVFGCGQAVAVFQTFRLAVDRAFVFPILNA